MYVISKSRIRPQRRITKRESHSQKDGTMNEAYKSEFVGDAANIVA